MVLAALDNVISLGFFDYAVMVGYMVVVIGLGVWCMKKEESGEDFILGGRSMPWWAVGISYVMSLFSTYSLVMVPSEIYEHGMSLYALQLLYPIFVVLGFLIFIRFYFRLGSYTPFEYLERRYDKNVRLLVAGLYFWGRLLYLAMVLFATSKVFEGGAGWPAWVTISLVGTIGIVYTIMGGMKAVIWTDVFQFVVMVCGFAAVVAICIKVCDGGFSGIISYAFEHGRGASRYAEASFYKVDPYVRLCFWLLLLGQITAPLYQNSADQISIQRLLSTSSYKNAFKAIVCQSAIVVPFTLVLWFFGLAIFSFYSQNPDPRVKSPDTVFFTFIATQLPTPLPGIMFAAMLAAVMSTLDSGMNSLSAVWLKEIHQKFINKNMSGRDEVRVSRIMTFVIGVFAVSLGLLVYYTSGILKQSVVEAQTIFAALDIVILPAFIFAVLSRRASSKVIWTFAFLCWGINFGMVSWYWSSHQGVTGTISVTRVIWPTVMAAVIWLIGRSMRNASIMKSIAEHLSLAVFGYAGAIGFWHFYAGVSGGGELSFLWTGVPAFLVFFVAGSIATRVSPPQPPAKFQGLTLKTMKQCIKTEN